MINTRRVLVYLLWRFGVPFFPGAETNAGSGVPFESRRGPRGPLPIHGGRHAVVPGGSSGDRPDAQQGR